MANSVFIEPDIDFIKALKKFGGEELSKCYQCATCSVACNLTPEDRPFPRKEMVLAQWGAADKLIYNPDVWLCHNCGDCTAKCPRGANPAEVLAAIRNVSFQRLAKPGFLGKFFTKAFYLIPLFALPVAIFLVDLAVNGRLGFPEGPIVYSKFFSLGMIDAVFLPTVAFTLVVSALQVLGFWNGMKKQHPYSNGKNIIVALIAAVIEILGHMRFAKCGVNKSRLGAHALTLFGFIALFITTNAVMVYNYVFNIHTPLDLLDPVKILGNAGAVTSFIGVTALVLKRLLSRKVASETTFYDSAFLYSFYLTILTGIGSEVIRLAEMRELAYIVYFSHLVFIWYLFAYMPFTKFSHLLYRTTAMVFDKVAGRR